MKDYQKLVRMVFDGFLAKQEKLDKQTMLLLTDKWGVVSKGLDKQIQRLAQLAEIKDLTPNQLFQQQRYKDFLELSNAYMGQYSKNASGIISSAQKEAIALGENQSAKILETLGFDFGTLPTSAIETFIGSSTYDGTPLQILLLRDYPKTVEKLTDTLLQGISLGKNPKEIARLMSVDMNNGNLDRALRIARTEVMNTYRESSRQVMQKQGLIEQWEWLSENDACEVCLSKNGTKHPITESMETHPNCRCAMLPVVDNLI